VPSCRGGTPAEAAKNSQSETLHYIVRNTVFWQCKYYNKYKHYCKFARITTIIQLNVSEAEWLAYWFMDLLFHHVNNAGSLEVQILVVPLF